MVIVMVVLPAVAVVIVFASLLFGVQCGVLVPNQLLRIPIRVAQERPTSEKPCSTAPSDASGEGTVIFTPLGLPLESMSMDEFLLGFHGRHLPAPGGDAPRVSVPRMRTAAKAWEDAPGQGGLRYRDAAAGGVVTLGGFLARNGAAMAAEGVPAPLPRHEKAGFSEDPVTNGRFHEQEQQSLLQTPMAGSGNGVASGGEGGRTRKRPALDDLVDKVDLRRQKRMIKNRESAARSRQRKQAYTLELESLVLRLEEENAILISEQEEQHEMRIHQLMENVIPITEKRKPPHILRKIHSMSW